MTRYPVISFPFQSPKSFYDIGTGAETLRLRPEWAHIKERDMGLKLPLSISQEKNNGDYEVRDADGEILMLDTSYYPYSPPYENALEIVNAVNSHASLLEEVERLREALRRVMDLAETEHACLQSWNKVGGPMDYEGIMAMATEALLNA